MWIGYYFLHDIEKWEEEKNSYQFLIQYTEAKVLSFKKHWNFEKFGFRSIAYTISLINVLQIKPHLALLWINSLLWIQKICPIVTDTVPASS